MYCIGIGMALFLKQGFSSEDKKLLIEMGGI